MLSRRTQVAREQQAAGTDCSQQPTHELCALSNIES